MLLAFLGFSVMYALVSAYKTLFTKGGFERVQQRRSRAGAKGGAADVEAAWFVIFQANFFYFAAFAAFAYVIVPAFGGQKAVAGLPWSWVHAAGSILPAAVFVFFIDQF